MSFNIPKNFENISKIQAIGEKNYHHEKTLMDSE